MKAGLSILGALLLTGVLIYSWGRSIPREHVAVVSVEVAAAPAEVLAVVTEYREYSKWRPDVKKVEIAGDVVTETTGFGSISYRVLEKSERRYVTEIVADAQKAPFGGTWTYEFEPVAKGTQVRITERGFVNPAVTRILSKYVFGHETTLKQYASDLERRFTKKS